LRVGRLRVGRLRVGGTYLGGPRVSRVGIRSRRGRGVGNKAGQASSALDIAPLARRAAVVA
jgi:hypothetical protein